jgi:peptide/nickel transport system substrate-binding protein
VHPGGHLRQLRNKGAIALFRGSWIADYADAENYLSCFISANKSPNGPNYTHYSGTEFDAGYTQAMELPDSLRALTYARMDARMMEQAPLIVLYYDRSVRLIANHVEGLGNNPMNQLVLKRVRLNKKANE